MTFERDRRKDSIAFDDLRRVAAAVSTDTAGYFMNVLHVEKKWVVASDGRRMHICPNTFTIPPGSYRVGKRTKTRLDIFIDLNKDPKNFPTWRRIISDIGTATKHVQWDSGTPLSEIILHRMVAISSEYLKDLDTEVYEVGIQDQDKAITFVTGNFLAVIAPMRIDSKGEETEGKDTAELLARIGA